MPSPQTDANTLFFCFLIVVSETLSSTYMRLHARDYMTRDCFLREACSFRKKNKDLIYTADQKEADYSFGLNSQKYCH